MLNRGRALEDDTQFDTFVCAVQGGRTDAFGTIISLTPKILKCITVMTLIKNTIYINSSGNSSVRGIIRSITSLVITSLVPPFLRLISIKIAVDKIVMVTAATLSLTSTFFCHFFVRPVGLVSDALSIRLI